MTVWAQSASTAPTGGQNFHMFGVPYASPMGFGGLGPAGPPIPGSSYPGGNPMAPVIGARAWLPTGFAEQSASSLATGQCFVKEAFSEEAPQMVAAGLPTYVPQSAVPVFGNQAALGTVPGTMDAASTGTIPLFQAPVGQAHLASAPVNPMYQSPPQYPDYRGLSPSQAYTDEGALVKQVYNKLVSERLHNKTPLDADQAPTSSIRSVHNPSGAISTDLRTAGTSHEKMVSSTTVKPDTSDSSLSMTEVGQKSVKEPDLSLEDDSHLPASTDQSPSRVSAASSDGISDTHSNTKLSGLNSRKATKIALKEEIGSPEETKRTNRKKSAVDSEQRYPTMFDR